MVVFVFYSKNVDNVERRNDKKNICFHSCRYVVVGSNNVFIQFCKIREVNFSFKTILFDQNKVSPSQLHRIGSQIIY